MNPLYRNDDPGIYPPSWYAASALIGAERAPLRGTEKADVAIVGAGYTGLSAALTLAERGLSVAVIEAHRVGFGASGRNGGHVTSGFNKDQQWLSRKLGDGPARALWDLAEEAKELVGDLCATHAPDARFTRGVMHGDWTEADADDSRRYADWLARKYDYRTQFLDGPEFREICRSPVYAGGVLDMSAAHVHPLRFVLGLATGAEAAGAQIFERTEATRIEGTTIVTPEGRVEAKHVILAGNGYLPGLSRPYAARVMPINSFIAATEPLGDRAAEVLSRDVAVSDSRFVVNYYRLSEDKRLLFGGRESYSIGYPVDILTALRARMERLFPQIAGVNIDYHWGGTLGITMSRLPYISRVAPGVLAAGGFSGHGVALSTLSGKAMAEAIAGDAGRFDTLSTLPVTPFPGGAAARAPLLTLAMTWYALRDRLGF
ncbi:NAD(P)/FAD-dependent oxidoreductase [Pelagovum pacificum]|uniref:FAD-binding oxidoreductase n=1 Tax=Pelagovum pacificum TaxID=2588711 RepID=A0A5C5GDN3_9RHOB|nr:FAD-binding oxidoreductase [Pelagovum pacificum]QQA44073.1 FAD-binding oxidoreductase [Pelagovum pacificum]TNY32798.1 FAD-binding oxidoreductase [Pelagovum pacificum]